MSDDLPNMHDKANNALVRLLSERLFRVRGGVGHFSPPLQEFADGSLTPDDAPGVADERADSGRSEGKS